MREDGRVTRTTKARNTGTFVGGLLVALTLASACKRRETTDVRDAAVVASPPPDASAAPSDAGGAVFALPGLAPPLPPRAGELRVEGYPRPLDVGMSDAADPVGFTRDGSRFAWCEIGVCCGDGDNSWCTTLDRNGKEAKLGLPEVDPTKGRAPLLAWAKAEGLVTLPPAKEAKQMPPPPPRAFAYGGEMTLVVVEIPATEKDGHLTASGTVKIGARLEGEKEPVFVLFPKVPKFCTEYEGVCMDASLNALVLSPAGDELGALVFIRNPSHGSTFAPARIGVHAFAARVFNDTGMRYHAKKEWSRSAELFTRAVYTDPREEKFAFNLACALARLDDPRAQHALRHAVALGGDAVRVRARKDADLEKARTAPWFTAAVR
jgi:hypothetical protein